jgi:hypothetical protein
MSCDADWIRRPQKSRQSLLRNRASASIENMDPSDYERLQQDVEELLEKWEETAQEQGPGSMDDTPLNRLIAERFEIEQIILASRGQQGNDFAGDETQDA